MDKNQHSSDIKESRSLGSMADEEMLRKARHELRTPLTVIKGVSELLKEYDEILPPAAARALERLDRAASQMEETIDRVLLIEHAAKSGNGTKTVQSTETDTHPPDALPSSTALNGLQVVLAEDQQIVQEIVVELLKRCGVEVTSVSCGEEVLSYLEKQDTDLVLMDIEMNGIGGLETTRRIRSELRLGDLPIIGLTAHTSQRDRELCLNAGMNDVLYKPINPEHLTRKLAEWFTKNKPEAMLEGNGQDAESSTSEILNTEHGLARVRGNLTLYNKLLSTFAENHLHSAEEIWSALDEGDEEAAIKIAHTVKGVAGTLGAYEVSECSKSLEELLRTGDFEQVPLMIRRLGDSLGRLKPRLANSKSGEVDGSDHPKLGEV